MAAGLPTQAVCATVGVSERRFRRWRARARQGDLARHPKSATVQPANALTPQEAVAIREAVACAEWADLSCRELSIKIMEREGLYVSHVAVWAYEKRLGIAGHRGKRRLMGRHRGAAPDTSFVTGPNQLWSWDFTKLPTGVPHQCWYLCAVLDRYSRKVVGWEVSAHADSALAQATWDIALLAEGLTVQAMPFSLSDRGPQMRSRTMREFFQDLGVVQLFARPRTPNDNAHTESLFATVKTAPAYRGVPHLGGCLGVLPAVLRLVQRGTSPHAHRDGDAEPKALRGLAEDPRRTGGDQGQDVRHATGISSAETG